MALTRQPTSWRAGVDYVGIANLPTFLKGTDQLIRAAWVDEIGDLDKDRALLEEFSPIRDKDRIVAPLYVYAGQNDPRVPREESDQVVEALRAREVPVEYQVALDEGHSMDHRENRVEFMTRVARFLEDHAQGRGTRTIHTRGRPPAIACAMRARVWVVRSVAILAALAFALAIGMAVRSRAGGASGLDAASCPRAAALGPTCGPCIAAHCCTEMTACYAGAGCIDLNDCVASCGSDEGLPGVEPARCPAECEARHAADVAAFRAWDECARERCPAECPRGPDEEEREEKERKR
jgi:hypothetical protein